MGLVQPESGCTGRQQRCSSISVVERIRMLGGPVCTLTVGKSVVFTRYRWSSQLVSVLAWLWHAGAPAAVPFVRRQFISRPGQQR